MSLVHSDLEQHFLPLPDNKFMERSLSFQLFQNQTVSQNSTIFTPYFELAKSILEHLSLYKPTHLLVILNSLSLLHYHNPVFQEHVQ